MVSSFEEETYLANELITIYFLKILVNRTASSLSNVQRYVKM
jgi:hypothetical protein